jgi:hypothetical protein
VGTEDMAPRKVREATDDEYERRVLTTPGVAEGFDEACREIEACERGLGEAR